MPASSHTAGRDAAEPHSRHRTSPAASATSASAWISFHALKRPVAEFGAVGGGRRARSVSIHKQSAVRAGASRACAKAAMISSATPFRRKNKFGTRGNRRIRGVALGKPEPPTRRPPRTPNGCVLDVPVAVVAALDQYWRQIDEIEHGFERQFPDRHPRAVPRSRHPAPTGRGEMRAFACSRPGWCRASAV